MCGRRKETDMTEMKEGDSVRNRKRIIKATISPQKQRKQHPVMEK